MSYTTQWRGDLFMHHATADQRRIYPGPRLTRRMPRVPVTFQGVTVGLVAEIYSKPRVTEGTLLIDMELLTEVARDIPKGQRPRRLYPEVDVESLDSDYFDGVLVMNDPILRAVRLGDAPVWPELTAVAEDLLTPW